MNIPNPKVKVLVFGDSMLDKYTMGEVTRISPEAPVPVLSSSSHKYVLGGATNVANNLVAIGVKAELATVFGENETGIILRQLIEEKGIEYQYSYTSSIYKSICKERIVAKNQQIVRIDYNDDERPSEEILNELRERLISIFEYDVVVISDYGKGVCNSELCLSLIKSCNGKGIPILVDPKGIDWGKYSGATLITPNLQELGDYLRRKIANEDDEIERALLEVTDKICVQSVLVTRSEKGMSYIDSQKKISHFKAEAKEVYDVSGAGDTVVATLAGFWTVYNNHLDAIRIANTAAGIVVRKFGTSVVTYNELVNAVSDSQRPYAEKICLLNQLDMALKKVDEWKSSGEVIVTTNGCFDIMHAGHVKLLSEAKKFGSKLIVGLNSDDSVRRLKGPSRPINNQENRALVLAAMGDIDMVVIFDEYVQSGTNKSEAPLTLLRMIHPDVHVKGGDYTLDKVPEVAYAMRFVSIPIIEGLSTSNIVSALQGD